MVFHWKIYLFIQYSMANRWFAGKLFMYIQYVYFLYFTVEMKLNPIQNVVAFTPYLWVKNIDWLTNTKPCYSQRPKILVTFQNKNCTSIDQEENGAEWGFEV